MVVINANMRPADVAIHDIVWWADLGHG